MRICCFRVALFALKIQQIYQCDWSTILIKLPRAKSFKFSSVTWNTKLTILVHSENQNKQTTWSKLTIFQTKCHALSPSVTIVFPCRVERSASTCRIQIWSWFSRLVTGLVEIWVFKFGPFKKIVQFWPPSVDFWSKKHYKALVPNVEQKTMITKAWIGLSFSSNRHHYESHPKSLKPHFHSRLLFFSPIQDV